MKRYLGMVAGLLLMQSATSADLKIKGYAFGDYYYVASGPAKEQNGFQIRRIYLTFDKTWNKRFTGRFRLEANDAGFGSNNKMTPAVKDAFLKYKKDGRSLIVGLSPTPTWGVAEGVWGYRSVEKTMMDLNKVGSSRDMGVTFETPLDTAGKVIALFMFGNGNSNKAETNNDKKGYIRLAFAPNKTVGMTVNADYETRPGGQDRTTLSALTYSSSKKRSFAVEGMWQQRKTAMGGSDVAVRGISVYGRSKTKDDFAFFGRVDYFDPNDQVTDDAVTRVIAGVDIIPESNIHIMPNVIVEQYQDASIDTGITPRITVFYKF